MGIGVFSFKLVVINQLYVGGITVREAEDDPPIGSHRH